MPITGNNFSAEFNTDTQVLTLTDISTYGPNYTGWFVVTDPNGSVIHSGSQGSPDVNNPPGNEFINVNLPVDANNKVILGQYTVQFSLYDAALPQTAILTKIHDLCDPDVTVDIDQTIDCLLNKITSDDQTDYKTNPGDTLVRVHTLYPPAQLGNPPIVSSNQTIIETPLYTQTWTTNISSTVTYVKGNDITEIWVLTGTEEIKVDCDTNLCQISCILRTLWNEYETAKNENKRRADELWPKILEITSLSNQFMIALNCGGDINAIYNDIKDVLGKDEDCCCGCDDDTPQLVLPPAPSGNDVVVQQGTGGIIITSVTVGNTTTYTVSYDPTAILNQIGDAVSFETQINFNNAGAGSFTTLANVNPLLRGDNMQAPSIAFDGAVTSPFVDSRFEVSGFFVANPTATFKVQAEPVYNPTTDVLKVQVFDISSDAFKFYVVDGDGNPVINNRLNGITFKVHFTVEA